MAPGVFYIPRWKELCAVYQEKPKGSPSHTDLKAIKASRPFFWSFARGIVRAFLKGHRERKFLDYTWGDIVDLMQDQAMANLRLRSEVPPEQLPSQSGEFGRQYSQQPCTKNTLQKRLAIAQKICEVGEPILLVGDDDFLGMKLVEEGFTDVTSVDIDPKVCATLEAYAAEKNGRLRVLQHDLEGVPPEEFRRAYRLVFLDPMYSAAGLELFFRGAEHFLELKTRRIFFSELPYFIHG